MSAAAQQTDTHASQHTQRYRALFEREHDEAPESVVDSARELQKKSGNLTVEALLRGPLRHGDPIPAALRLDLERRFDTDFSAVRLHTGSMAAASATTLQANAYTVGNDIVFGPGRYAPSTHAGRRLLAHELAHVIQQRRGGARPLVDPLAGHERAADAAAESFTSSSDTVSVEGATAPGIARDPVAPTRLSPEEMLQLILEQRGWTNKATQPRPPEGPNARAQAAQTKGPRLGHGRDTHSFAQVTDRNGKVVAHELGGHLVAVDDVEAAARKDVPRAPGERGKVHAERMNVGALERRLRNVNVAGGTLEVMVDQIPCSPQEKDCLGHLRRFAEEKKLKLKVYVADRESQRTPGARVTPKTAAQTAFKGPEVEGVPRTGSAQVRQIWPPGETYTPGGGRGPGGPVPTPRAPAPTTPAAPRAPKLSAESLKLLGELEKESASAARFAGRIRTYTAVAGGLLQALGAISAISDAQSLLANGTVLDDAQKQANKVEAKAELARQEANERWDAISFIALTLLVENARRNGDQETLDTVTANLGDYAAQLDDRVTELEKIYKSLSARAEAMRKLSAFLYKAVQVPQEIGTMINAAEFSLAMSLEKLAGTVGSAAAKYEEAYTLLNSLQLGADKLASIASSASWEITFTRIARRLAELEQKKQKSSTPPRPPVQAHDPPPDPSLRPKPQPTFDKPVRAGTKCPGGCHTPNPGPSLEQRFGSYRSLFELKLKPSEQDALIQYIETLKKEKNR